MKERKNREDEIKKKKRGISPSLVREWGFLTEIPVPDDLKEKSLPESQLREDLISRYRALSLYYYPEWLTDVSPPAPNEEHRFIYDAVEWLKKQWEELKNKNTDLEKYHEEKFKLILYAVQLIDAFPFLLKVINSERMYWMCEALVDLFYYRNYEIFQELVRMTIGEGSPKGDVNIHTFKLYLANLERSVNRPLFFHISQEIFERYLSLKKSKTPQDKRIEMEFRELIKHPTAFPLSDKIYSDALRQTAIQQMPELKYKTMDELGEHDKILVKQKVKICKVQISRALRDASVKKQYPFHVKKLVERAEKNKQRFTKKNDLKGRIVVNKKSTESDTLYFILEVFICSIQHILKRPLISSFPKSIEENLIKAGYENIVKHPSVFPLPKKIISKAIKLAAKVLEIPETNCKNQIRKALKDPIVKNMYPLYVKKLSEQKI